MKKFIEKHYKGIIAILCINAQFTAAAIFFRFDTSYINKWWHYIIYFILIAIAAFTVYLPFAISAILESLDPDVSTEYLDFQIEKSYSKYIEAELDEAKRRIHELESQLEQLQDN